MRNRSIRTAVVTGPTGAIGHALCERLLAENCEVFAVVHPCSTRAETLPRQPRLHRVVCDGAQYDGLPRLIGSADVFFHLAWAGTTGAGREDMPLQIQNIHSTIQAVRGAAELGCRMFVGAGSQAEYGRVSGLLHPDTPVRPETGYGMAKLCAGQMSRRECSRLGMDHVWARVLSVYGPCDGPNSVISSTIRQLLAGECPALTPGEQLWDFLYAADAADAFWRMALYGRDGGIYPVGSGKAEALRCCLEVLRDEIDPSMPLGFGRRPYGENQIMHLQADIGPLQQDTGFVPRTQFRDGIRETIQWIRRSGT